MPETTPVNDDPAKLNSPPTTVSDYGPPIPSSTEGSPAAAPTSVTDYGSDISLEKLSAPPAGLQKTMSDIMRSQIDTTAETDQRLSADRDRMAQSLDRMAQSLDRRGASPDDIKPWDAQKAVEMTQHDPMQRFGSAGVIMALAASAFTRQPALNAINGMAAGAEAIKQNDDKAYDRAFEAWKTNTDLLLKRHQMQHQDYMDAAELMKTDAQLGEVRMRIAASQYGDMKALALIDAGMIPEVMNIQSAQAQAAEHMAKAKMEILEFNAKKQALEEYDREGKKLEAEGSPRSAIDRARFIQELNTRSLRTGAGSMNMSKEHALAVEEYIAAHPGASRTDALRAVKESETVLTGNKRADLEGLAKQYDYSEDRIDKAIAFLDKYIGGAGAAGKVTRSAEAVSNIFGSNQTDRKQFERWINYLQEMAPTLLHERAVGRGLKSDAAHVNNIIGGLSLGDTTANTKRSLTDIKQLYERIKNDLNARLGEGGGSGREPARSEDPGAAPAGPKSEGNWWEDFNEAH